MARSVDWENLKALFEQYRRGNVSSTRVLFTSLTPVLRAYFSARLNSKLDADDLAQASLLKIHFSRDRFNDALSLKTWVFTIASRTLIDHWRGEAAHPENHAPPMSFDPNLDGFDTFLESIPSELLDPESKTTLSHDLNLALEKLKPIERSIVYLYGVEGLSMAEIAEVHQLSEAAVKVRAHRAYHSLREFVKGAMNS